MAILTPALLVSFLYLTAPALSLFKSAGPVPLLNPKSFDEKIRNSKHASIVEFFAPWCGHCKKLVPEYVQAAEDMMGIFTFAAVNCDDKENQVLCAEFEINEVPSFKFMKPSQGGLEAQDYDWLRTAKGFTDYAEAKMENLVVRLTDEKLPFFVEQINNTAKAVLFTNESTTSALWKSLAIEFWGQMIIAQTSDTQKAVVKEFNVDKYPTLVVLPGGSAPGVVYSGPTERDPMYKFLSEFAPVARSEGKPLKEPPFQAKQQAIRDYTPRKITDVSELWTTCFKTHGTCYLLLSTDGAHINAVAAVNEGLTPTKTPMRIYSTELFAGKESLFDGNAIPALIAVNGVKEWYKKYEGTFGTREVSVWMDAVELGEGKKYPMSMEKSKELFSIIDDSESSEAELSSEWSTTETATTTATAAGSSMVLKEGINEREQGHDEL